MIFEFKPFEYPQRWEGFEPYMSAIDLLFNMGEKSKELIENANGGKIMTEQRQWCDSK